MTWARASEWVLFALVALGLHLVVFVSLPAGVAGDAGVGGQGNVTLQAMTPRMAAMIASIDLAEAVETPNTTTAEAAPQVAPMALEQIESIGSQAVAPAVSAREPVTDDVAVLTPDITGVESASTAPPVAVIAPTPNAAVAVPLVPRVEPPMEPSPEPTALVASSVQPANAISPSVRTAPARAPEVLSALPRDDSGSAFAPELSRIPPPRPYREPVKPAPDTAEAEPRQRQERRPRQANRQTTERPSSSEQNVQHATGQGGGQKAGARRSGAASLSNAQRQNLKAKWGNQIRARIERRKPSAGRERGAVGVRIAVTVQGQLAGVSIARSSGSGTLDRAAVRAVQRAGRFPSAPKGVGGLQHVFTLTIKFGR